MEKETLILCDTCYRRKRELLDILPMLPKMFFCFPDSAAYNLEHSPQHFAAILPEQMLFYSIVPLLGSLSLSLSPYLSFSLSLSLDLSRSLDLSLSLCFLSPPQPLLAYAQVLGTMAVENPTPNIKIDICKPTLCSVMRSSNESGLPAGGA